MKRALSYVICLGLFTLACNKTDVPAGTPACIESLIEQIKTEPVWSPLASVIRYQYRGQVVYYVPPRCCDILSALYDSACNRLCAPDGGIGGGGDGRCADFLKERTAEQVIWTDSRR